eukprot:1040911-Amphidinium_carterae.1
MTHVIRTVGRHTADNDTGCDLPQHCTNCKVVDRCCQTSDGCRPWKRPDVKDVEATIIHPVHWGDDEVPDCQFDPANQTAAGEEEPLQPLSVTETVQRDSAESSHVALHDNESTNEHEPTAPSNVSRRITSDTSISGLTERARTGQMDTGTAPAARIIFIVPAPPWK